MENLKISAQEAVKENWLALAYQLQEAQSFRKKYELEEKKLKDLMINLQGNQSHQEDKFALVLETRSGSVHYKSIPELIGVDLDKYRGEPVDSWRFKVLY